MNRKEAIAQLLIGLAEYYDKVLSAIQIDMYLKDLEHLEIQDLVRAIEIYRRDRVNRFFPFPAQLIGCLEPTDEEKARDAAQRITTAISRYGADYELMRERAKAYVGELGWAVVQDKGGWSAVLKSAADNKDNFLWLETNYRKHAEYYLKQLKLGTVGQPPRLPKAKKDEMKQFDVKSLLRIK